MDWKSSCFVVCRKLDLRGIVACNLDDSCFFRAYSFVNSLIGHESGHSPQVGIASVNVTFLLRN